MSDNNEIFRNIYNMGIREISRNFTFLGQGISRQVFAIDDNYVVKIAKGIEGLHQNKVELYVFNHCDNDFKKYLCPIIWHKPDMLVMPRAIPLSYYTHKKYFNLKKLLKDPKAYEDILYITKKFYLLYEDIVSVSSWGFINNKPVLIDYGCTTEKGDYFYDSV